MSYDSSWQALLDPGQSSDWFVDFNKITSFAHGASYQPNSAWLCCEVSRLCYFDHQRDPQHFQSILGRAQLSLVDTVHTDGLLCHLLVVNPRLAHPFTLLAFRGTAQPENWLFNLNIRTASWCGAAKVHEGFLAAFEKLWSKIARNLSELPRPCYFTGHSLGGALAILAAGRHKPEGTYTFGAPKVGNAEFARQVEACTAIFRVLNHSDLVTTLPWKSPMCHLEHAGECHYLNSEGERVLNPPPYAMTENPQQSPPDWRALLAIPSKIGQPIKSLSDHSPINYLRLLGREIN